MGMTRRNLFLPDELWDELRRYAIERSYREAEQVSISEAVRRILEDHLQGWRDEK